MKTKYNVFERNLLCDALVAKCEKGVMDENDFDILAVDDILKGMVDKKIWKRQGMFVADIEGTEYTFDMDKMLNIDTKSLAWE